MGKIGPVKKGALHKDMGVAAGKPIPTKAIQATKAKAEKSGDALEVKRATFALNARKWNHK